MTNKKSGMKGPLEVSNALLLQRINGTAMPLQFRNDFRQWLLETSAMARHLTKTWGWEYLAYIYGEMEPKSPVDLFISFSEASYTLWQRAQRVAEELISLIKGDFFNSNREVVIGDFGCGSGYISRMAIEKLDFKERLRLVLVDTDEKALETAKKSLGTYAGDGIRVDSIKEDILKLNRRELFDVIMLIGIICPLEKRESILVLKKIRRYLKKQGLLITGVVDREKLKYIDPRTLWLVENFLDWEIKSKAFKDIEEYAEASGFEVIKYFDEGRGVYPHALLKVTE